MNALLDLQRRRGSAGPDPGRIARWVVCIRATAAVLLALASCTSSPPSITPFPLPVDTTAGPVSVGLAVDDELVVPGVIDTMSPLTIIDSFRPGGEIAAPRRRTASIGVQSAGVGVEPVTQVRFSSVDTLDLHPCHDPEREPGDCAVGLDDQTRVIRGILGADVLSRYAVRFDLSDQLMQFFPDIAGDDRDRTLMCEAVFQGPFHGAGTLVIGGAERPYSARRIALGACFVNMTQERMQNVARQNAGDDRVPAVSPVAGLAQGLDALFLLSTGIGITIVAESTYAQYKRHEALLTDAPPSAAELVDAVLHLASGPIAVRLGAMSHLALVAEVSEQRGPCSERYANAYLTERGACDQPNTPECPCRDALECRAGAVVELCGSFPVAVMPDDGLLLQGLRDELRPALPEVDGILGTDIMKKLVVDVDYPNGRVLLRCAPDAEGCRVRPAVVTAEITSEAQGSCPSPSTCPDPQAYCSTPELCSNSFANVPDRAVPW